MRPVAAGRPDSADLEDAVSFGRSICQKIADGNPSPITVPRGKLSLMARILPADSAKMMIKPPRINSSNCLKCGACAHVCPVYAIDPVSFRVNHKTCIRCAACVKSCHLDARSMQFRIPIFDYVFMQMGKKRKRNIQIV
jgi:ferredoxin